MENLVLSVLVITYNQENYITQTLDSILNQVHNYSYEIIIGDDLSTDNTRSIIQEYARKFPNIIKPIYNAKNLGIVENFFNVLQHCSGKYIMECAGDDYWLPGKVKRQIDFMESHNEIGLCYGKTFQYDQEKHRLIKKYYGGNKTSYEDLFIRNSISALTVCYRKTLVDKYIIDIEPLNKSWKLEDIPMWLWFAKNSKIYFNNYFFGVYRILSNSGSHFQNEEKQNKFLQSCKNIRLFYSQIYPDEGLMNYYEIVEKFDNAWANKKRKEIQFYGRQKIMIKKDTKTILKIIFSTFLYKE